MAKYNFKSDLKRIVKKYLEGKASEEEKAFLEKYYSFFNSEKNALDSLSVKQITDLEDAMEHNILLKLKRHGERPKWIKLFPYKYVAAAVLLIVGLYAIYHVRSEKSIPDQIARIDERLLDSGENVVMLTLSDGKKVKLQDIESGIVAEESGTKIEKKADGTIVYTASESTFFDTKENRFNTISTPNGQLSQINLPDGTKVWLNAESSLKYPVAFIGNKRLVELNGEAYFEVAKNKEKPFVVKAKDSEIKVLGTKFNVSAYSDDNFTKTTLAEGLVSIAKEKTSKLLKPGQQALILNNQSAIDITNVDTEEAMAWKNGYFMFNNMDIKTVMTMISRWYDIEVEYQGKTENEVFIGTVSRFEDIEKLLRTIELTGIVHFKISDNSNKKRRKVVVMP
ncbi:anti-FecI sigma factor, FecR [Pseudopedobacter saltans DSM 12145]|uniref:Anti-FecI sigma factor, FecR n=1 Tax=Pseudopedobacter saltans (strain ATCC 51119 / DSM 12145 / JCM 21818 / CCUG 39354 / LMG 10337 / NBRC 100064 / NCIMB 13643) TaxID=762903 RepID=F0SBM2_PSESL|nr:FecR family protein [Pseudopedobacter saltans]ADY51668.1 anti-FecI sigma factor, FecR [Pseudopedobacter saltans DSM 12145]